MILPFLWALTTWHHSWKYFGDWSGMVWPRQLWEHCSIDGKQISQWWYQITVSGIKAIHVLNTSGWFSNTFCKHHIRLKRRCKMFIRKLYNYSDKDFVVLYLEATFSSKLEQQFKPHLHFMEGDASKLISYVFHEKKKHPKPLCLAHFKVVGHGWFRIGWWWPRGSKLSKVEEFWGAEFWNLIVGCFLDIYVDPPWNHGALNNIVCKCFFFWLIC